MKLFAIDPGTTESAWVYYDTEHPEIIDRGKSLNEDLLFDHIVEKNRRGEINAVAIEMMQCMGMAVGQSVLETCVWIGEFRTYFKQWSIPVHFVYRNQEKMHLCGSMRAKDANIRQALIDRFGEPGTKKNPGATYGMAGDMWSALAVAVTCAETIIKET